MSHHRIRIHLQIGIAIALIAAFVAGSFALVRAQGRSCRDIVNVTVCADQFLTDVPGFTNAQGNITIGLKGKEAYVIARAVDGRPARFLHDVNDPDNLNNVGNLIGAVTLVKDTQAQPLVSAAFDGSGNPIAFLDVNVTNGTISESEERVGSLPFSDNSKLKANYLDRFGLRTLAKDGTLIQTNSYAFNPNLRNFSGFNSLALKVADSENNNLLITLKVTFNEQGQVGGTVNDVKARIAGLIVSLKTIAFGKNPSNGKPFFEAATATIAKVDNPGVPGFVPNTDQTAIFTLTKIRYEDGKFTIGGGEVPIPDWQVSSAFSIVQNRIGLAFDETTKTSFFTVRGTLRFTNTSATLNPFTGDTTLPQTDVPIILKIGAAKVNNQFKPVFQAGLQDMNLKLSSLKFKLKGVTFVGDTVQNFYGIQATTVDVSWPSTLGGQTTAGIKGFRLGTNKDAALVFNLEGGKLKTPAIQSGVLQGSNLEGNISAVSGRVEVLLRGTASIRIPGNSGVAPTIDLFLRGGKNTGTGTTCKAPSCLKRFEMKLSGFGVKLAGFELTLVAPRGTEDGGFAADQATLKAPLGVNLGSAGFSVTGIVIAGNGNVTIAGGGFEMPPLGIGDFQFVGARGSFAKLSGGGYEFIAGATVPLPGLEPGGGKKISAELRIRTNNDGSFRGFGVSVSFQSRPGIPLSGIPAELTGIGGSFDLNAGTVQIGVSVKIESSLRLVGLPLAALDGNMTLQPKPFKLTANAKLSILIFNVASASMGIGDGQGFSGGKGFNAGFQFNGVIVKGQVSLRIGKLTVNGVEKTRFALSGGLQVGLKKGQFGFAQPPFDINIASVSFQGGTFKDSRNSPTRDTAGLLGSVSVGPFSASVFVDLSKQPGSGGFISLANANKLQLINALIARQRAAQGEAGYASVRLSPDEGLKLGLDTTSPDATLLQETIPVTVSSRTTLVVGVHYTTGNPTISLRLPNNSTITEATVNNTSQFFVRDLDATEGNDVVFILKGADPGDYSLIVDNAPADYTKVSYELNEMPTVSITQAACGGGAISGVTVACNGAGAGGSVNIAWTSADIDSPDAKATVGYVALPEGSDEADPAGFQTLADGRPLGAGSFLWELDEVPTGRYKVVVRVEDGSNAPADAIATTIVEVTDGRAPAEPSGIVANPLPGELSVVWTPNSELDVQGYEIGFGVVQAGVPDSPNDFVYVRNTGFKEVAAGGGSTVDAKIWGLNDNQQVFVGLRAYDASGNFSDWVLLRAAPWPLAPDGWTPVPDGRGGRGTIVEIAFGTALQEASLSGALTLRDAGGNLIAGTVEFITDLDGEQIIGLRLTPSAPLPLGATFTATLEGGAGGVQAADGRTMPQDYSWSFTVANEQIFLPVMVR